MTPGEDYLAAVRADVPAWSFRRAGMLREIRDGLDDAAAAYVEDGLPAADAERAAVEEFGSPARVAASIRAELAVETGRVAAMVAGVFSGAQMVISEIVWRSGTDAWGYVDKPTWYGVLAQVVDTTALVVLVVGVVVAALLGRAPRLLEFTRRFDRVRAARTAAIGVLVVVVLQAAAGIVLTVFGPGAGALLSYSPLEALHSPTMPIIETMVAVQCLRLASGGAGKQDGPHHAAERLPFTPA